MAATDVYLAVRHVPEVLPRRSDEVKLGPLQATSANFNLLGGRYAIMVKASTYGSLTLQILGPDGATWLNALRALTADEAALIDAPKGTFRLLVA
jgi:hypothetical protein